MKIIPTSLKVIASAFMLSNCMAATFVFGDGFAADGTGSFGTDPLDNAFSAPGNADRDPTIGDIEISTLINLTGTNTNPFGPFMGNPDTFDPFVVGEISFLAGQIFRSGLEFDLSALEPAPTGFEYEVTAIEFFIEVSGATFGSGLEAGEDVAVGVFANQPINSNPLTSPADATITLDSTQTDLETQFVSVSLDPALLDLNTQNNFEIVLDAGPNPDSAAIFGSSLVGSGQGIDGGVGGTNVIAVAPAIRITTDLVAIPEPSSTFLLGLGTLGLMFHRRRK